MIFGKINTLMKYGAEKNIRIVIDQIIMILLKICDEFYFFPSRIMSILIAIPMPIPIPISIPIVRERQI